MVKVFILFIKKAFVLTVQNGDVLPFSISSETEEDDLIKILRVIHQITKGIMSHSSTDKEIKYLLTDIMKLLEKMIAAAKEDFETPGESSTNSER